MSDLLFKELLYSEIYLASPAELNDPLDLNGRLDFFSENETEIRALVRFLQQKAFVSHGRLDLAKDLMDVMSYERLGSYMVDAFSNCNTGVVTENRLFDILSEFYEVNVSTRETLKELQAAELLFTLDELFGQFLNNSSAACFSESNTNFLMWSHYASGHTGICLEFELAAHAQNGNTRLLPMLSDTPLEGKYLEWMENVKRVRYPTSLLKLKFYDYLPLFYNAGDVDLMNLSKSYWHQYAYGIENMFLEKLAPWSDEKEWRLVHVSFQETTPEDRIFKFNSAALTGVYLGAKMSEYTQDRVKNVLQKAMHSCVLYKCNVDGTRGIGFERTQ
ncbi:MAG: DUF2971 domain-containing protein [Sedimentisphaerales bacterium]|nr:DUF2971 domain-containing protein [Sedimentisphaerales bacterium]